MSRVHVYRTDLSRWRQSECYCLLDAGEVLRASRMTGEWARHEFVCARAFLKTVLGTHVGATARQIRIANGPFGKPALVDTPLVHFNLSHSGGVAVVAVAEQSLGIDIEAIEHDMDHAGVATEIYSDAEIAWLDGMARSEREREFFTIWTRKEAYLKATGTGFSADLKSISTAALDGTIEDVAAPADTSIWHIHDLNFGTSFKAALVIADKHPHIVIRRIDGMAIGAAAPGNNSGLNAAFA